MSVSRCLRCALDAARPAKRINIQPRSLIQSRHYADAPTRTSPQKAGIEIKTEIRNSEQAGQKVEEVQHQPAKRSPIPLKPSPSDTVARVDTTTSAANSNATSGSVPKKEEEEAPAPPNVVAAFRTPYRHPFTAGVPVASLQLRSFSVRNLEFFADFAMRVAYYLKLPATGPAPLPRKTERWTVLRSNFVNKKSQQNFERITMKRLITIYDGEPEVVEIWLACLRKWQFYGVGMKANVWHFEGLDVAAKMDKQFEDIEKELDAKLANFGWNNSVAGKKSIAEMLRRQGGNVVGSPMSYVRDEISDAKYIDLHRDVQ